MKISDYIIIGLYFGIILVTGYDKFSGSQSERKHQECISFGDSMDSRQEKQCKEFGA